MQKEKHSEVAVLTAAVTSPVLPAGYPIFPFLTVSAFKFAHFTNLDLTS